MVHCGCAPTIPVVCIWSAVCCSRRHRCSGAVGCMRHRHLPGCSTSSPHARLHRGRFQRRP